MTFLLTNGAYGQYARGAKLSHNKGQEEKKTANKLPAISRQSLFNSFIIKLLKRGLIVQRSDQRERGRGWERDWTSNRKEKERKAVRYVSTIVALSRLCQSTWMGSLHCEKKLQLNKSSVSYVHKTKSARSVNISKVKT